jgi:hypothetical protein
MNKQVKLLAEQAGFDTDNKDRQFCINNFAELMLSHVDTILRLQQDKSIEEQWNIDESFSTVRGEIEELFGVNK